MDFGEKGLYWATSSGNPPSLLIKGITCTLMMIKKLHEIRIDSSARMLTNINFPRRLYSFFLIAVI